MASTAIRALWAQATPDEDPEVMAAMGMMKHVGEAFAAGRITEEEGRRLQGYLAARDERYLAIQTGRTDG